jgi:hypothetical protein
MQFLFPNGITSVILRVKITDATSATGAGLTGLTGSTSGLIISTIADVEAAPTVYTSAASHIQTISTLGTYVAPSASDCRFKEVDSSNHPGLYEIQLADARFAVSGARSLEICISGAANAVQLDTVVQLTTSGALPGANMQGATTIPSLTISGAVVVNNSGGDAVSITSGNGVGIVITSTTHGIYVNAGSYGIYSQGTSGGALFYGAYGVEMVGTSQQGLYVQSYAIDAAVFYPGSTGIGIHAYGGQTSGASVQFDTNGSGQGLVINNGIGGVLDGTITYQQGLQAMLAVLNGVSSGFNSGIGVSGAVFKDPTGAKNRVTVNTNGTANRTSITNDFT